MQLSSLSAISPVDGRYRSKTASLDAYFSELALMRYRVRVEIEYFIALCNIPLAPLQSINSDLFPLLRKIYTEFTEEDAKRIKVIEQTTNHDVKAVEYFIKEKFEQLHLDSFKEFIHFGLTSQDINNTAFPLAIKEALTSHYDPFLEQLIEQLRVLAQQWANIPMLARTHGQPASPTRLGKEFMVFVYRLEEQYKLLKQVPITAKFGGATGNFNAHYVAYPTIDWKQIADKFIAESLGLQREQWTTQISNYDHLAALFDGMKRLNTIFIDLCRDIWMYISMDYFKQRIKAGEVGSSAMPHKVNPIDFENAEGNFGIANALFDYLSQKLPVSRLQRDLTDSTVLRNVGVPFAHTMIAFESLRKGLDKLVLHEAAISQDLENNWAVVAEAIQTILRREGYPSPYEALKSLTRTNEQVSASSLKAFIDQLNVNEEIKKELRAITPHNYTGL
jgi:adenylosuccinate lyase